ncbi:MAG TPA: BTAD domain-containing putative transcriptional regulator [Actinoallomurus sp.]
MDTEAIGNGLMAEGGVMEFRLFGDVQVLTAGGSLNVGTPRQQAVLAALVIDARRAVAIETLIDRVWDDTPPAEVRNVLYSHLSRIRQLLKQAAGPSDTAVRLERRHAGYVLDVDPDLVDLHRFGRLVDRGRDERCADADRVRALAEALGLWRGTPLAALTGDWVAQVRSTWHRRRLDATVHWARAELRLGHPDVVIHTLPDLVTEYPLAEPLEGLLMEALYAAGRGAEAIDRYTTVRQRLGDHLGIDPGSDLQTLYQAILRGELPSGPPSGQAVVTAPRLASPAQLPPDVYGFTGRDTELHHLDELLTEASSPAGTGGTVVISAIHGTAGIGKTALALHWAHKVAGRFGDGQLYVNLRGFDPTGSPVAPTEAVRGFLDAFDVPPERISATLEAQVGLYRSLLAGRRVLVVLDNARDAEQVRPLLPGAPGCMAVVTSRNQLAGLVASAGARPMTLDLPTEAEARDLLAHRLGPDRLAAGRAAVSEIIALCARLPLALAIVATRAAMQPAFPLAVLADELREARGGLGEFAGPDPATDVRAVFSWSYLQLSPAAARLFRLLGLHPGSDIATPAAASLAGQPISEVRPLLTELAEAHLVEHTPGRYACHDLLRAYALELARTLDGDGERDAALHRVFSHYMHSAYYADRLLNPQRDDLATLPPIPPGVRPEHLTEKRQAFAWFGAEHRVLLAVIRQVGADDALIWQLASTLIRYFAYQGHWQDSIDALSAALGAARRLADPVKEAFAHRFLACTYIRLGRFDDSDIRLRDALDLSQGAGDTVGEAHTHRNYAWLLERQGRYPEALAHAERALDLFQTAGHQAGQARALNAVGWFQAMLGDYEEAITYCHRALQVQKELGDRFGQAETWDSIGYAHHHLGRHATAITCYETAAALYREFDDRYNEADTLTSLGDAHHAAGQPAPARTAWRHALDLFDLLGHPDADDVRIRLANSRTYDQYSP